MAIRSNHFVQCYNNTFVISPIKNIDILNVEIMKNKQGTSARVNGMANIYT